MYDRRVECGQQLAHSQRIAFRSRAAPVGRRGALLPQKSGRRALAARHAVDGVVHEDGGDVFAAVCGVQNLRGSDGRQVAIPLVADDNAVRAAALDGGAHGGCAAVRRLHVAHVEVVVSEHRTADRADQNGAVLDAKLVDGARHHLVDDAVAASGAVVRLVLQLVLALVAQVKGFRLAANDGVFGDGLRHRPGTPRRAAARS